MKKFQDELKVRIKFGGKTNALDKMLSKHTLNKDTIGLGCDVGQCSTSGEETKKEIHFVYSSDNGNRQTFIIRNALRKKIDLTTTIESLKTQVVVTRRSGADPKGKGKLNEDSFIRDKYVRRKFRRPPIGMRPGYVATQKNENQRKSRHMSTANEHPRINNKGKRNGANQLARCPHT